MENDSVKYPTVAKAFLALYFVAQFIILPFFARFIFEIKLTEYVMTLIRPSVLIYVLAYLALGMLYIRFFTKLIENHNGKTDSAQKQIKNILLQAIH